MINYLLKEQGKRLKQARTDRFQGTVSQKELAEMLGISTRTYQNWENGVRTCRDKLLFIKLCNILKVDPAFILYGPSKGKFRLSKELKTLLEDAEKVNQRL